MSNVSNEGLIQQYSPFKVDCPNLPLSKIRITMPRIPNQQLGILEVISGGIRERKDVLKEMNILKF